MLFNDSFFPLVTFCFVDLRNHILIPVFFICVSLPRNFYGFAQMNAQHIFVPKKNEQCCNDKHVLYLFCMLTPCIFFIAVVRCRYFVDKTRVTSLV